LKSLGCSIRLVKRNDACDYAVGIHNANLASTRTGSGQKSASRKRRKTLLEELLSLGQWLAQGMVAGE
jgi:hypothetical protein